MLLATNAYANPSAIDMRLLVDVSQATHIADKTGARRTALEYFIRTLPDEAVAGVWSYARYVRQVAKLGPSNGLWKQVASIHAASLQPEDQRAKLTEALRAASKLPNRHSGSKPTHIVLLSSGVIDTGLGIDADTKARQALLTQWLPEQQAQNRRIHTFALGDPSQTDHVLLRQLSDSTGGLHLIANSEASLQQGLLDVQAHIEPQPMVQADSAGRFQVAPGAERLTVTWFGASDLSQSPSLQLPNGIELNRSTALPTGRWLVDEAFEMLTISQPPPGWWRLQGKNPDKLVVFGEIDVEIEGVEATVVPTDESRATISLFDAGKRIEQASFLDLLEVRAWVHSGPDRSPLPVERQSTQFVAHFVSLDDGPHQLEVELVAPTFKRQFKVPFTVANPMLVDILPDAEGTPVAWLQFTHPKVDYATLKATGVVRKPPQIASLIPGERMPGGVWRIPLDQNDGIVEVSFSVAGNFLDGSGLFIKTKPHAIRLPLVPGERQRLRYDAQGKMVEMPPLSDAWGEREGLPEPAAKPTDVIQAPPTPQTNTLAEPAESSLPLIPLWFVGLISLLNVALAGLVWWFNKPKTLLLTQD